MYICNGMLLLKDCTKYVMKRVSMPSIDAYFAVFGLTNVALIHLSCSMDKMKSKCAFYAVAVVAIYRMSIDIYMPTNPQKYALICPLCVTLIETILLRYIVLSMHKYTCSPPIILLFMVLAITSMDAFHIYKDRSVYFVL